jgi:hypothetical protein
MLLEAMDDEYFRTLSQKKESPPENHAQRRFVYKNPACIQVKFLCIDHRTSRKTVKLVSQLDFWDSKT